MDLPNSSSSSSRDEIDLPAPTNGTIREISSCSVLHGEAYTEAEVPWPVLESSIFLPNVRDQTTSPLCDMDGKFRNLEVGASIESYSHDQKNSFNPLAEGKNITNIVYTPTLTPSNAQNLIVNNANNSRRPPRPPIHQQYASSDISGTSDIQSPPQVLTLSNSNEIEQSFPTNVTIPEERSPRNLHPRAASTSEISALTETIVMADEENALSEIKMSKPRHHRGISWMKSQVGSQSIKSSPSIQCDVKDNASFTPDFKKKILPPPPSLYSAAVPPPTPAHDQQTLSSIQRNITNNQRVIQEKLAWTERINPLETEAETAILQALEESDRDNQGPSTGSHILPHMTDAAVMEWQALAVTQQDQVGTKTSPPKSLNLSSPYRSAKSSSSPGLTSTGSVSRQGPTNSKKDFGTATKQDSPHPSIAENKIGSTELRMQSDRLRSSVGNSPEESLIDQNMPRNNKATSLPRNANVALPKGDVESTLYSLSNIMRNIHDNEQQTDHLAISNNNQNEDRMLAENTPSFNDKKYMIIPTSVDLPKTQSDTLANHAALLYRGRSQNKEHVIVSSSPGTTIDTSASATPPTKTKAGASVMSSDPKKNDDAVKYDPDDKEKHDLEFGTATNIPHVKAVCDDTSLQQGDSNSNNDNDESFSPDKHTNNSIRKQNKRQEILLRKSKKIIQEDLGTATNFLMNQKTSLLIYVKHISFFLIFPATSVSALLFYAFSNPSVHFGYSPEKKSHPSISWFILFICVRQIITLSLAKATEVIIIELIALKTRLMTSLLGPLITLMVVQSKGWPFTVAWWALYNLILLSGDSQFAHHWVYYQTWVNLFNEKNPSGNITSNIWNFRILYAGLILGNLLAYKRFALGLYLGGRQYATYGSKLALVIHKMIVISQVSGLARQLEWEAKQKHDSEKKASLMRDSVFNWDFRGFEVDSKTANLEEEDGTQVDYEIPPDAITKAIPSASHDHAAYSRVLSSADKFRISQMLESWEEPPEEKRVGAASVKGVLQFKQTLAFMDLSYPFSQAFGLADSRGNCVKSSEEIFNCFVLNTPQSPDVMQFEAISVLAMDEVSEKLDEKALKGLVKIFRPDRDGTLSLVDFVRSIDQVYKELRLLRASIRNSSRIDYAFEAIINVAFYFMFFCGVLISWEINPLTLFLSLSSVILAFSFAIGNASSKYFEGILFILLRKPYDIGDRISINDPNEPPGSDGVFTWFVEDVTLYYTTVRLGATNEVATISNSSLALSRIVNAARSLKAVVYITLKFGLIVPYTKIQLFKTTVESFIKARPREWLNCSTIRSTRVEADLGFIEYVIVLQHRDSWQNVDAILESKAVVVSFCLEVQKQLGMRYVAPATPVSLTLNNPQSLGLLALSHDNVSSPGCGSVSRGRTQSEDLRGLAKMFPPPYGVVDVEAT